MPDRWLTESLIDGLVRGALAHGATLDEAGDVVQDLLEEALSKDNPEHWARRVVKPRTINYIKRSRSREEPLPEDWDGGAASADSTQAESNIRGPGGDPLPVEPSYVKGQWRGIVRIPVRADLIIEELERRHPAMTRRIRMHEEGLSIKEIARREGVTQRAIQKSLGEARTSVEE